MILIKNIKALMKLNNHKIGFTARLVFTKVHYRTGISNICKDNMRCNFIDFSTSSLLDGSDKNEYIDQVEDGLFNYCYNKIFLSCRQLQGQYNQGDYFIIQSYPRISFHAFCLDKNDLATDRMMLMNTKYLDIMYGLTYREGYRGYLPHTPDYKVLRFIEKNDTYLDEQLTLIGIVKSNTNYKLKSRMHNVFFNARYNIPMYTDSLLDDSDVKDLEYDVYESLR